KVLNKNKGDNFVDIRIPFIAGEFSKNSGAEKAGVKKGDRIIAADSAKTLYHNDFLAVMKGKKSQKSIQLTVIRDNKDTLTMPVQLDADGKIGVFPESELKKLGLDVVTKPYT